MNTKFSLLFMFGFSFLYFGASGLFLAYHPETLMRVYSVYTVVGLSMVVIGLPLGSLYRKQVQLEKLLAELGKVKGT